MVADQFFISIWQASLLKKQKIYNNKTMEDKILTIRKAQIDDLQEITDIYNEAVLETISTFHLYPRSWRSRSIGLKATKIGILFWW